MAGKIKEVDTPGFDELIAKEALVLVDFWAPWCGPCRMLAPIMESLAEAYDGKVAIAKVNVDDNHEVAVRYGISSIPTVILFQGGKVLNKEIGVAPETVYRKMIDAAMA